MTLKQIEQALLKLLTECDLEYQTRLSPEEIGALAKSHAQAYLLAMRRDRTAVVLRLAFLEHRREVRWFPRPAEILERFMPIRWRLLHRPQARARALPARLERKTPGFGKIMCAIIRRDVEEYRRLLAEYPEAAALVRQMPRARLKPEVLEALGLWAGKEAAEMAAWATVEIVDAETGEVREVEHGQTGLAAKDWREQYWQ